MLSFNKFYDADVDCMGTRTSVSIYMKIMGKRNIYFINQTLAGVCVCVYIECKEHHTI